MKTLKLFVAALLFSFSSLASADLHYYSDDSAGYRFLLNGDLSTYHNPISNEDVNCGLASMKGSSWIFACTDRNVLSVTIDQETGTIVLGLKDAAGKSLYRRAVPTDYFSEIPE